VNHLLLRAADEVGLPALRRVFIEGFGRGEHLGLEQTPEGVVRIVLALVRRRRQQKDVVRRPRQPPRLVRAAHAGDGLGQLVALGLANTQIVAAIHRQLVGFIENHQVIRHHAWFAEAGEHARARERVHADDQAIAALADERVGVAGVRPGDDRELQAEQRGKLAMPVPDQTGGRDNEDALDEAAGLHLPDVQTRHDGLARTGIIGQQEPQGELLEHVLIDGDPLVRQRIDL